MDIDDPSGAAAPDDHCLVHHFIRTHGRTPDADELRLLRQSWAASAAVPGPRPAADHPAFPQALRREVARLIHRL